MTGKEGRNIACLIAGYGYSLHDTIGIYMMQTKFIK